MSKRSPPDPGRGQESRGDDRLFAQAAAALSAGDLARAEALCEKLAKRHDGDPALDELSGLILLRKGELDIEFDEGTISMSSGDVLTVPIGKSHRFVNAGDEIAEAFIVRGGDSPQPPQLFD